MEQKPQNKFLMSWNIIPNFVQFEEGFLLCQIDFLIIKKNNQIQNYKRLNGTIAVIWTALPILTIYSICVFSVPCVALFVTVAKRDSRI